MKRIIFILIMVLSVLSVHAQGAVNIQSGAFFTPYDGNIPEASMSTLAVDYVAYMKLDMSLPILIDGFFLYGEANLYYHYYNPMSYQLLGGNGKIGFFLQKEYEIATLTAGYNYHYAGNAMAPKYIATGFEDDTNYTEVYAKISFKF